MMELCEEKKIVLHDFSELIERLGTIKITLNKNDLSPEFQGA
jgi:small subunit ribosomal protein S29